jgi:hypothetical protein
VTSTVFGDMVLFESLDQQQIGSVVGQIRSLRFEVREMLFARRSEDAAFYVVASGVPEVS